MVKKTVASFEDNLTSLEAIVEKLEKGELSLDESLRHFEHGIKLARLCHTSLKNAEQKVDILMKQGSSAELETLEVSENDD